MKILAIETSCDETAAAVVRDGQEILSSVVSSQVAVHAPYGGIVPEIASRHHTENICPVVEQATRDAGVGVDEVDAIAVTQGPGLIGALLVGLQVAKGLAFAHRKPLIPVHHIAGHIHAPRLTHRDVPLPALALVVSGGHTSVYEVPREGCYGLIGRTRDDAAGEAFDKVAKLLGLGYPGGPVIDRLAERGDDSAVSFKVARMTDGRPDFSFSGLKTAVLHHVRREGITKFDGEGEPSQGICDLAASFQAAVVRSLLQRLEELARQKRPKSLLLTGGVAANSRLRRDAASLAESLGLPLLVPPIELSTDNAAMIAAAGHVRYRLGVRGGWDLNADPNLPLTNDA